ncbi:MAG: glycosyltransferase domain-containing protein [Marinicellaceae bacterium]
MKKCVVYTTITKGYDVLKDPLYQNNNFDFVCFTDDQYLESKSWTIKTINTPVLDQVRQARYLKLHPHLYFSDYRYSIWVDGSLSINGNMMKLLEEVVKNASLGIYAHAKRNCLYQAALNCIDKKKDEANIIEKQMEHYSNLGYPKNNGLVASGVLVRDHHDETVIDLMHYWWKQIANHSRRDQLSFNYVCWKKNFSYYAIPTRIGDGRFFRRNPHLL